MIESTKKTVKLLGVTIDNELKFSKHIEAICTQASQKNKCYPTEGQL